MNISNNITNTLCTKCWGAKRVDMQLCHGFGRSRHLWVPCFACNATGLRSMQEDKLISDRQQLPETD